MPQLTERDAEKLSPDQATALVRVLDLQARWDGLLVDKGQQTGPPDLHARQKANDAYQAALRDYAAKYRDAASPSRRRPCPTGWRCGAGCCGSCSGRRRAATRPR